MHRTRTTLCPPLSPDITCAYSALKCALHVEPHEIRIPPVPRETRIFPHGQSCHSRFTWNWDVGAGRANLGDFRYAGCDAFARESNNGRVEVTHFAKETSHGSTSILNGSDHGGGGDVFF